MGSGVWRGFAPAAALVLSVGCVPDLPGNVASSPPKVQVLYTEGGVTMAAEDGLVEGVWLEVCPDDAAPCVGGYLGLPAEPTEDLVILLPGASTLNPEGVRGTARAFHFLPGPPLRDAGFTTWSLAYPQCGTPYGRDDLAYVLRAIDWARQDGADVLGVRRVFVLGYSTGGTLAYLVARQRALEAVAVLSGASRPEQFYDSWGLYRLLALLFPDNEGMCQAGMTLAAYGPPGSPAWDALDTVGHLAELQSPLIVVHGLRDVVYPAENAMAIEQAYQTLRDAGISLPPVQVHVLPGIDHFSPPSDPEVIGMVIKVFRRWSTPGL